MVKDGEFLEREKRAWLAAHPLSLEQKFDVMNALLEEARVFGHFGKEDLFSGVEHIVRLAAMLNANVSKPSL